MLGSQGTQAQGVLLAPARATLGRLPAPTKWQQWLQLPAMVSFSVSSMPRSPIVLLSKLSW